MRNPDQKERKRKGGKNALKSGHYVLPAMPTCLHALHSDKYAMAATPNGSARTPLGPKVEFELG
jgi:hypothetical protein